MLLRKRPALAGLSLLVALAACHDGEPLGPAPAPKDPVQFARLECSVTVATGTMRCDPAGPGTGGAQAIIIGGQGTHVFLQASNHTFVPGDDVYSIDVTVENLIGQALGTVDGISAEGSGVRVFFEQEPVATEGVIAPISILNETGYDLFLRADQLYFQYDGILPPNATSAPRTWMFSVDPGTTMFRFGVYVSAAVQFPDGWVSVTPAADTLLAGQTTTLAAVVKNALGRDLGARPVTWATSDAGVATVNASGAVTAVAPGTATITATSGPRTGAATIAVCPALAVGQAYVVADLNATPSLCLSSGEYTLTAVNTSSADNTAVGITGAGIIPVSGPPSPARLPGGVFPSRTAGLTPDDGFERRLRDMERRDLSGRAPSRGPGGARRSITPGVPAVGALMSLNVETDNSCSTSDIRTGRVVAVGTRVIVLADTANPSGGLSSAQYANIAAEFDSTVHPTVTGTFGAPSDRDGNGRVIAFYTRAVNELTARGSRAYVGGFFFSRDLLAAAECPTSNVGEMFYLLAADPAGAVNGNVRTVDLVQSVTLGTMAHELEHLVNASRRMIVNAPWNGQLEEAWLDEGLAHVAEELMFYHDAGLNPRSDLDSAIFNVTAESGAFFKYGFHNFGRLRAWLLAPQANGPFQSRVELATRGAVWAYLRYAADRRGGTESTFWNSLVNTGNTGLANLQAALGTDPVPWFRDFSAAMYADDAFGGTSPAAEFTQPSWDFRSLYGALDFSSEAGCTCEYPLSDRNPTNGVTDNFALVPGGGTAYVRMGVSAGAFAGVTVRSGSAAPPSAIRMVVIRRK